MLRTCRKILVAGVHGEIGDQACGLAQGSWRRTYDRFIIPTLLNNAKCCHFLIDLPLVSGWVSNEQGENGAALRPPERHPRPRFPTDLM